MPANHVGAHNLLTSLPREYSQQLLSRAPTVTLPRGEILFQSGAVGDGCYWLEEGVLKVSMTSRQGEERIVAILGAGAIVGELAMIDGLPRSATVEAVRDCKLTFVSRATFLECLREHPDMYRHLVSTLVVRLRQADEEVAAASFLPPRARVARALLRFAEYLGEPADEPGRIVIRHRLRQTDIAAMADVARESASRILSDWKKSKVVEQYSTSFHVLHKQRLEREAKS